MVKHVESSKQYRNGIVFSRALQSSGSKTGKIELNKVKRRKNLDEFLTDCGG
jgi:hypothetical protein